MHDPSQEDLDADNQLDILFDAIRLAHEACEYRTCARIAWEVKRLAKAERKLIPYLQALYMLTVNAVDLLDLDQGREAAIEMIALLESEDRARLIQSDFDEEEYAHAIAQMSSCAYDNLATITAEAKGYNSEGAHGAISEGIQICRNTGKLECITCFRAYGTNVYRASDDLELALHHARQNSAQEKPESGVDQRWMGANDETDLLLISGEIDAAEIAAKNALALSPTSPNPLRARLQSLNKLETVQLLKAGDAVTSLEKTSDRDQDKADDQHPSAEEYPQVEMCEALKRAVEANVRGEHDAAIRILADWDRRLTRANCLDYWFEVRLRLIAAHRLAGLDEKVPALARALEAKAQEARDWLTLRRLAQLQDPRAPVSPIAALAPLRSGPLAAAACGKPVESPPADEARENSAEEEASSTPPEATPREQELRALWERFREATLDPELRDPFINDMLAFEPASISDPLDAVRLLRLANLLPYDNAARASSIWAWAEALVALFPRNATLLSLLADLGDTLRDLPDSPVAESIAPERLEALFRQSLDLDPNDVSNFARAASYSLKTGDLGEAERRFARSFRLDRNNAFVALRLSQIYEQTDRARDALSVLDMCLRNGCESSQVAWNAVLLASGLGQFEVLLTYLDRYEALEPDQPWVNYYRSRGLLELGRPQEAIAAIEEERRRQPNIVFPITVFLACAESALGRLEPFREHLRDVLQLRLSEIDYLTKSGLNNLFESLWKASAILAADDPLRTELEDRLLGAGLAPNALFEPARQAKAKVKGVGFYRCDLIQPLDENWPAFLGCLADEAEWESYQTTWGVLALSEEDACQIALAWQKRCYPKPAVVESCSLEEEGFTDHPGVVWQSFREEVTA